MQQPPPIPEASRRLQTRVMRWVLAVTAVLLIVGVTLVVVVWRTVTHDDPPSDDTALFRHTAKHGFRTYDILHVASALVLRCGRFWSFDDRAKKLAKLEGLKVN